MLFLLLPRCCLHSCFTAQGLRHLHPSPLYLTGDINISAKECTQLKMEREAARRQRMSFRQAAPTPLLLLLFSPVHAHYHDLLAESTFIPFFLSEATGYYSRKVCLSELLNKHYGAAVQYGAWPLPVGAVNTHGNKSQSGGCFLFHVDASVNRNASYLWARRKQNSP